MGIILQKCEFFHEEIKSKMDNGWLEANKKMFLDQLPTADELQ